MGTKRFIAYCQPLGSFLEQFWPPAPGQSLYEFPDLSECDPAEECRTKTFRTGETFMENRDWVPSEILAPLDVHRDDLLLLENIDNYQNSHPGYTGMLTGYKPDKDLGAEGPSIDQVIAREVGSDTLFSSLHFGIRTKDRPGTLFSVSWFGRHQGIVPEKDPRAMWMRLFAEFSGSDASEADQLLAERRSVLDAALGQASSLERRLGVEDRRKFDQFLTAFREVERRIALAPVACAVPEIPDAEDSTGGAIERGDLDQVPFTTNDQIELMVLAMACDLTRVATFQMAFEATNMLHPWLGVSARWHDLSHNAAKAPRNADEGYDWRNDMRDYVKISRFNAEVYGQIVQRMKDFDLLDDAAILWTNSMANGANHNSRNLPLVLAGSAGGFFDTGRHVRFEAGKHKINDLHVSILQSMGIAAETFGAEDGNLGPLTELHS